MNVEEGGGERGLNLAVNIKVAKTVLPPAMMDVREGNYELLSKQAYISHDYVDIKIKTSEAQNGIERIVNRCLSVIKKDWKLNETLK